MFNILNSSIRQTETSTITASNPLLPFRIKNYTFTIEVYDNQLLGYFSSVGSRIQEAFVLIIGYEDGQVNFLNLSNMSICHKVCYFFTYFKLFLFIFLKQFFIMLAMNIV